MDKIRERMAEIRGLIINRTLTEAEGKMLIRAYEFELDLAEEPEGDAPKLRALLNPE